MLAKGSMGPNNNKTALVREEVSYSTLKFHTEKVRKLNVINTCN